MPDTYSCSRKPGLKLPKKTLQTLELMPQYQIALRTWEDLPVCKHDKISSGVQRVVQKPKEIPLWATFGIDLFLDIQTVLGGKQSKPFDEIQREADIWLYQCINPAGIYIPDTSARNEAINLIVKQFCPAVKIDQSMTMPFTMSLKKTRTASTTTVGFWRLFEEEYYFMKRHPVRCGLMKHHLYSKLLKLYFGKKLEKAWKHNLVGAPVRCRQGARSPSAPMA
jgi:hypothetical protein